MSDFRNKGSFPISSSLNKKIKSSVKLVKDNPEGDKSRIILIDVVNGLVSESLDYYFNYSLKVIGLNIIARKSIKAIVSPFKSGIHVIAKQVIKKMNDKQLLATINFIYGFVN